MLESKAFDDLCADLQILSEQPNFESGIAANMYSATLRRLNQSLPDASSDQITTLKSYGMCSAAFILLAKKNSPEEPLSAD